MMTFREARQRCQVHRMGISRTIYGEFRVFFPELKYERQEATAYYTDDLLDAVCTAGAMRQHAGVRAA